MQERACDRLAEAEMVFLPEFEHLPNGFLTRSGSGKSGFGRRMVLLERCLPLLRPFPGYLMIAGFKMRLTRTKQG